MCLAELYTGHRYNGLMLQLNCAVKLINTVIMVMQYEKWLRLGTESRQPTTAARSARPINNGAKRPAIDGLWRCGGTQYHNISTPAKLDNTVQLVYNTAQLVDTVPT